jgi:hypothetical protein
MARGPIFQRASTVSMQDRAGLSGIATLDVAQTLPEVYWGYNGSEATAEFMGFAADVREVIRNATVRAPIRLAADTGCPGECEAKVPVSPTSPNFGIFFLVLLLLFSPFSRPSYMSYIALTL